MVVSLLLCSTARAQCNFDDYINLPDSTYLFNNMWGQDSANPGYYECIAYGSANRTSTVKYSWSGNPNAVKAYPAVVAGWSWGYRYGQGAGGLPVRVYENHTILTSFEVQHVTMGGTEAYDVSYDLWLGPNDEENPSSPAVEIMIWLTEENLQPLGSYQYSMSMWGTQWDFWSGWNDGGWTTFSFVRKSKTWSVTNQNISDFVNWLWTSNQLDGRKYLVGIQAGVELSEGEGEFQWQYSLNVQ